MSTPDRFANRVADRVANLPKAGSSGNPGGSGNQRNYFVLLPHVVLAYCRTPHDLALWLIVKMIAGEQGVCILSSRDLGVLAGMSATKVIDSRTHLLRVGLLTGRLYRDPDYPVPVWHLRIPNLWPRNSAWRHETGDGLYDRIAAICATRQNLDRVAVSDEETASNKGDISSGDGHLSPGDEPLSPGDEPLSPGDEPLSPGDAKKNQIEPIKGDEYKKPNTPRAIWNWVLEGLRPQLMIATFNAWLKHSEGIDYDGHTFTVAVSSEYARDWLTQRLMPRIVAELERATGVRVEVRLVVR